MCISRFLSGLVSSRSSYTDDSLMSLAAAKWLAIDETFSHKVLEEVMVGLASHYECPMGGHNGGYLCCVHGNAVLGGYIGA